MSTMEDRFDAHFDYINRVMNKECECTRRTSSYIIDYEKMLKDFIRTECAKEYERGKQDGLKEGK